MGCGFRRAAACSGVLLNRQMGVHNDFQRLPIVNHRIWYKVLQVEDKDNSFLIGISKLFSNMLEDIKKKTTKLSHRVSLPILEKSLFCYLATSKESQTVLTYSLSCECILSAKYYPIQINSSVLNTKSTTLWMPICVLCISSFSSFVILAVKIVWAFISYPLFTLTRFIQNNSSAQPTHEYKRRWFFCVHINN